MLRAMAFAAQVPALIEQRISDHFLRSPLLRDITFADPAIALELKLSIYRGVRRRVRLCIWVWS